LCFCLLALAHANAHGQWAKQTIDLEPGWQAVHLQVTPSPNTCDAVFEDLPIEVVATWNPPLSQVQYINNPSEIVPSSPDWLLYYPQSRPEWAFNTLRTLEGGKPYFIKLAGENAVEWNVTGKVVYRPIKWLADALNVVGFNVPATGGPSFQEYFAASDAHAGQAVFRFGPGEEWQRITNLNTAGPIAGEAYLVYCEGGSDYQGPVGLDFQKNNGLDYSDILTELTVKLNNETASNQTVTLSVVNSVAPSNPGEAAVAGNVPLSYWHPGNLEWVPITSATPFTVSANSENMLRLAVRRPDMSDYTPPQGVSDYQYQSVAIFSSGAGDKVLVPVSARGIGAASLAKGTSTAPRAGLWLGTATINAVSEHLTFADPNVPTPAHSEFTFRLIVHVDSNGVARLLQQVMEMWKPGTFKPDPENPNLEIVDQPGEYVLVTDRALAEQFEGATVRDGQPVGRRVSSAGFGFAQPLAMNGGFPAPGDAGNIVSATIAMDYDDPVNPFKHTFHPDHDNLAGLSGLVWDEGVESYTVIRDIELEFEASDPEGLQLAGWGDNQLGGTYRETISGIHKDDIKIEGFFRLRRVSPIAALNPNP
jgi:hypothetical protein